MPEDAFAQFIAPENAWMHEILDTFEQVVGVSGVDAEIEENGKLSVTVTPDQVLA